jgi:hypothetical protein
MYTPSDRYGDLDIEDITELEELPADDGKELNFNSDKLFYRSEARSFERDLMREFEEIYGEDFINE